MVRSTLLASLLLIALSALAQPYKVGCHYFRNRPGHPVRPVATDERANIEDVIARSDTFDILHYDLTLDVTDVVGKRIRAAATITFTPLLGGHDITFDLIDTLTVDSVVFDGAPVPFTHADDLLAVDLPPNNAGDTLELTVHYQGKPQRDPNWGGFYFQAGYIYNLGIGLSTIPPNFGKVWYPCFDSFVERASYTYHVKSAGGYRAHCQGDLLGEELLGGDTLVRHFALQQQIPSHISAIAVANYVDSNYVHTGVNGDIPVRLTAKATDLGPMAGKMSAIGDAIDCYEFWYGPYPYDRVGYVLTTDGALEIAENIAYPDFMTTQTAFDNRGLLGHELGHHWWGDAFTMRTHNDMWMKEGPAEYSGHLLEEWIYGREDFIDVVLDNHLRVLETAHVDDEGFQALSPMPDPHIYGTHTYYKGASVMHNLRAYLGDTLFRQGLRNFQVANAGTTLNAAGFRDSLEAASGMDLDAFFDAWVFNPGFSVFVVDGLEATDGGTGFDVQLTLRQRLRGTDVYHQQVPLDITLIGAQRQRQEYQVTASGELSNFLLNCPFEPVMAVVNGHRRLNQARMDHEFTIAPGETFTSYQPRVEFQLFQTNIVDSTLFRVEHIWAAPEASQTEWGVYAASGTHYWVVDGVWPEGTALNARVFYHGANENDLDFDLFGDTEENAVILYRADAGEPWRVYEDQTLTAGNLFNGTGNIKIEVLRKGHYAFGKGSVVAAVAEPADPTALELMPNPAADRVVLRCPELGSGRRSVELVDLRGAVVLQQAVRANGSGTATVDLRTLAPGLYTVLLRDADGALLQQARLVVAE